MDNPMRAIKIEKVVVNMGVGEGGEKLKKAEQVMEQLTKQKPVKTIAKRTNRDFGIKKGMPIGCKVTLRKDKAIDFLKKALWVRDYKLPKWSFSEGTVSFGIKEHTEFEGMKYQPEIGIFGLDVCITFERNGYRVKRRKIAKSKLPEREKIKSNEIIDYMKKEFNVEVIE
ncbi:MAG: 50S ribosomal protein L5 [Thermoplasmatales archaeon]|nr:50S ribosomal protein L5 [Thermoplasmatales archaeon]